MTIFLLTLLFIVMTMALKEPKTSGSQVVQILKRQHGAVVSIFYLLPVCVGVTESVFVNFALWVTVAVPLNHSGLPPMSR